MSDPFITIARVLMLVFAPLIICVPLIIAVAMPRRGASAADRISVRGKIVAHALATLLALVLWGGLALAGTRFAWARWAADSAWLLFFPLWVVFGWPVMRMKNPAIDASTYAHADVHGVMRTASLVNRERRSPVRRWMWVVAATVCIAGPLAIGLRAIWILPEDQGANAVPFGESADHLVWLLFLVLSVLALADLLWLPRILKSMLLEPEPMDASGSPELAKLYARQRRRRVLGMFWLLGVAAPLLMSGIYTLAVWIPRGGAMWGVIGGIGGSVLGIAGAVFGWRMAAERARIMELRARLDRQ